MTGEKLMMLLAENQLRGFAHASKGYGVVELANSMNLKKHEWIKLRKEPVLKESDKKDLDKLFNI